MKLSGSIFDIEKTKIDFVKRVPFPPFSLLFYLVHYRSSPIIWYICQMRLRVCIVGVNFFDPVEPYWLKIKMGSCDWLKLKFSSYFILIKI